MRSKFIKAFLDVCLDMRDSSPSPHIRGLMEHFVVLLEIEVSQVGRIPDDFLFELDRDAPLLTVVPLPFRKTPDTDVYEYDVGVHPKYCRMQKERPTLAQRHAVSVAARIVGRYAPAVFTDEAKLRGCADVYQAEFLLHVSKDLDPTDRGPEGPLRRWPKGLDSEGAAAFTIPTIKEPA